MNKFKKITVLFSVIMILLACSLLASCAIDKTSPATLVLTVQTVVEADQVVVSASSGDITKNGDTYTIKFANRNNHTITVWAKDYLAETIIVSAVDFKKSASISRTVKLENKKLDSIKFNIKADSLYNVTKVGDFAGDITKKGSLVSITVPKSDTTADEKYIFNIGGEELEPIEITVNKSEIIGGYYAKNIMLTEKNTRLIYVNNVREPHYLLTENLRVLRPISPNFNNESDSSRDKFFIKLDKDDKVIIKEDDFITKVDGATILSYGTVVEATAESNEPVFAKKLYIDKQSYENNGLPYDICAGEPGNYINKYIQDDRDNAGNFKGYYANLGEDGKFFIMLSVLVTDENGNTDLKNKVLEYTFTNQQIEDSSKNPIKVKTISADNNGDYSVLDADYVEKYSLDEQTKWFDISKKDGDSYQEISLDEAESMLELRRKRVFSGEGWISYKYCSPKVTYKFKFDKGIYDTANIAFMVNNTTYNYEDCIIGGKTQAGVGDADGNVTLTGQAISINETYKITIVYKFTQESKITEDKYFLKGEYTVSGSDITLNDVVGFGGYGRIETGQMYMYQYKNIIPSQFRDINVISIGASDVEFVSESINNTDIVKLSYNECLVKLTAKFKVRIRVYASGSNGQGNFVAETIDNITLEQYLGLIEPLKDEEGNIVERDYENSPFPMKVTDFTVNLHKRQ